jgi:hypothetical protein
MIYICNHKPDLIIKDLPEGYKILGLGPAYDDSTERDNINYLNPYINETTGLYDIWKNCNDEYVGVSHYRRAFYDVDNNQVLRLSRAKALLRNRDIICTPYHTFGKYNIAEYFKLCMELNGESTLEVCNYFLDKLFKAEPDLGEYLTTEHKFIARNMFVCRKEIIDKYCEWLFPLIIPITEEFKDNYLDKVVGEERMIGHLVERIFSYWIEHEDLKKLQLNYYTKEI